MGGSMPSQPVAASAPADNGMDFMGFGDDNGFGNQNEPEAAGGDDWAAGFGDDGDSSSYDLNFAKSDLKEVLSSTKEGNKQKKAGLGVNAAVNYNTDLNRLEL